MATPRAAPGRTTRAVLANLVFLTALVGGYLFLDGPVPYTVTWRGTVDAVFEGTISTNEGADLTHVNSAYPYTVVTWAPVRAPLEATSLLPSQNRIQNGPGGTKSILVIRRLGVVCTKAARFGGVVARCPALFASR